MRTQTVVAGTPTSSPTKRLLECPCFTEAQAVGEVTERRNRNVYNNRGRCRCWQHDEQCKRGIGGANLETVDGR